jgi:hypothetical protein
MNSQVWSDIDGPVRSSPVLCPVLQIHMAADAVPKPVRIAIRVQVITLDVLLDKFDALGIEAAVIACSAFANEKIRMRLATIISSIEQVWIGQAKEVDVGHQLCTVEAGTLCLSARCLDTRTPLGCNAYLHRLQIRVGSGWFMMSPSFSNFRATSLSLMKLHA